MILFLLLCCFGCSSGVIYRLNETEHEKMPNIIRLDPYGKCLREPEALYCTAMVNLVSETASPLLQMIKEYSAVDHKHFNYTHTYQGVCMNQRCKGINSGNLSDRLESCLNRTFWKEYRLKTRLMGQVSCNNEEVEIDASDMIVAALLLGLIALNVLGTLYDFIYTTGKPHEGIEVFLCFSIRRNFKRLVNDPSKKKGSRPQLKALNGLRSLSTAMVIWAHSILIYIFVENPHFLEEMYYSQIVLLLMNSGYMMQIFFMMSGLLLVYNNNSSMNIEKYKSKWIRLLKEILRRWLRLTPSYVVVLAITATWMRHMGTGPLWNMIVNVEVTDCRRHWWQHLIYINNYFENSHCLLQSWYLAADMQLFWVGIAILVFCRSRKSRIVTLSALSVISIILVALHTYYQDLDAVVLSRLESARNSFIQDKTFNNMYKRGHTNLLGYILGLAVGYILYYWNDMGIDLDKYKKFRPLYWCTIPAMLAMMYSGSIFYQDRPRLPLLFRTAYATLVKPMFSSTLAIFVLGVLVKYDNVFRGFLEWKGWTVPSNLSYSAYLLHIFFVRLILGMRTSIAKASMMSIVNSYLGLITFTFAAAFPFWILLEGPVVHLVKTLMPHDKDTDEEKCESKLEKFENL